MFTVRAAQMLAWLCGEDGFHWFASDCPSILLYYVRRKFQGDHVKRHAYAADIYLEISRAIRHSICFTY